MQFSSINVQSRWGIYIHIKYSIEDLHMVLKLHQKATKSIVKMLLLRIYLSRNPSGLLRRLMTKNEKDSYFCK